MSALAKQIPEPEWPTKRAICLHCRTSLFDSEHCHEGHRVIKLGRPEDVDTLVRAHWDAALDTAPRIHRLRRLALAGVLWASCAALLLFVFRSDSPTAILAALLSVGILGPSGYIVGSKRLSMRSFRDSETRPLGALAPQPLLLQKDRVVGTIVDADEAASPLSGELCAAYGVWLYHHRAKPSTLVVSDAASQALKVQLGDGRIVEIPPGRISLAGPAEVSQAEDADVRDFLALAGLLGPRGESLVEFDEVRELTLRLGDRVVIHGELRSELDPGGEPGTYREPPAQRLVPTALPAMELLE